MIGLSDIWKSYRLGRRKSITIPVLRGIELHVARGEYLAIMGPSGSGKSTLLNIIGCLDRPSQGTYHLADQPVDRLNDAKLSALRGRCFGFIFQSYHLIPQLTVLENIQMPLLYQSISEADGRDRAALLATQVGLGERLDHKPTELSGGQQQRVAVARALANDPDVILADEPTGNLDSTTGREILDLLGAMNQEGKTLILVTHNRAVAEQAHRIVYLLDGRIADCKNCLTPSKPG